MAQVQTQLWPKYSPIKFYTKITKLNILYTNLQDSENEKDS